MFHNVTVGVQLFPDMKYSMSDLNGGDPSTLCQLDVQVMMRYK